MAKVYDIYAYGDIAPFEFEGVVSLASVVKQMTTPEAKEATEIVVHINSPGGFVSEGFAIHDYLLNSGKDITTINEGLCASIATVVYLSGTKRKMAKHSEFMIHNPWTFAEGNADDLRKYADDLEETEERVINFYAEKTGLTPDQLAELMDNDTFMTAQEALDLGFATEILDAQQAKVLQMVHMAKQSHLEAGKFKAVAKFNPNKTSKQMAKKPLTFAQRLMSLVNPPQMKSYTLSDGTVVESDSEDDIAVGQTLTINGEPAPAGDHTLEDGRTVTVDADGKVTAIAEGENDEEAQAAAIAEAIKLAIKPVADELASIKAQLKEQEEGIIAMAKATKTTYQPKARTTGPEGRVNPATQGGKGKETELTMEQMKARREEYKNKNKK